MLSVIKFTFNTQCCVTENGNGFSETIKWHWWFKLISETLQLDKFRLPAFTEAISYKTEVVPILSKLS